MRTSTAVGVGLVLAWAAQALPARAQEGSLPGSPASVYSFDVTHSSVAFAVRHWGLTNVRGSFPVFVGSMLLDEDDMTRSSVTVVVDLESVDSGNESRDDRLRETFFDIEAHPYMVFQSETVGRTGDGLSLRGTLALNGVRSDVVIPVQHVGYLETDQGTRHAFQGEMTLERSEFGVEDPSHPFEQAGAIGDEVTISLELQLVEADPATTPFFSFRKPSAGEVLYETTRAEGVEAALGRYARIRTDSTEAFVTSEREVVVASRKLVAEGRAEEAAALLETLLEQSPESAGLHGALGEALLVLNRASEGIRHLERAVELEPRATRAREMLRWGQRRGGP